jgi:hypothetical protein
MTNCLASSGRPPTSFRVRNTTSVFDPLIRMSGRFPTLPQRCDAACAFVRAGFAPAPAVLRLTACWIWYYIDIISIFTEIVMPTRFKRRAERWFASGDGCAMIVLALGSLVLCFVGLAAQHAPGR